MPTEETLDQMLAETDFVMWMLDYAYEKLFLAEARHSLVSNGSAKERYGCKSTVEGTLSIVWRGADGSERNHTLLQRREDRRDQYSVVYRHGSAPEDRPLRRYRGSPLAAGRRLRRGRTQARAEMTSTP